MIGGQEGADPGAIVYDAVAAAKARNADVLLCDTAGRLHNKKNLMEELRKINRILEKEYPDAFRETLVVLDATTGQNALAQAREFADVADITGIILTKMDGTARWNRRCDPFRTWHSGKIYRSRGGQSRICRNSIPISL